MRLFGFESMLAAKRCEGAYLLASPSNVDGADRYMRMRVTGCADTVLEIVLMDRFVPIKWWTWKLLGGKEVWEVQGRDKLEALKSHYLE